MNPALAFVACVGISTGQKEKNKFMQAIENKLYSDETMMRLPLTKHNE